MPSIKETLQLIKEIIPSNLQKDTDVNLIPVINSSEEKGPMLFCSGSTAAHLKTLAMCLQIMFKPLSKDLHFNNTVIFFNSIKTEEIFNYLQINKITLSQQLPSQIDLIINDLNKKVREQEKSKFSTYLIQECFNVLFQSYELFPDETAYLQLKADIKAKFKFVTEDSSELSTEQYGELLFIIYQNLFEYCMSLKNEHYLQTKVNYENTLAQNKNHDNRKKLHDLALNLYQNAPDKEKELWLQNLAKYQKKLSKVRFFGNNEDVALDIIPLDLNNPCKCI